MNTELLLLTDGVEEVLKDQTEYHDEVLEDLEVVLKNHYPHVQEYKVMRGEREGEFTFLLRFKKAAEFVKISIVTV